MGLVEGVPLFGEGAWGLGCEGFAELWLDDLPPNTIELSPYLGSEAGTKPR
jgi:hypothetical protein